MTAGDFMKLLDDTDSVILSRKLFRELLDNQRLLKHRGMWSVSDARMHLYECSLCQYQVKDKSPFCPWCGAEMINPARGKVESEGRNDR